MRNADLFVRLFSFALRCLLTVLSSFFCRWRNLRRAQAGQLLTNHYRMQISRRKYNRSKRGTIRYQALFRGFARRRVLAAIRVATYVRMYRRRTNFRMLKSAVLALQCATRFRIAKKVLKSLQGEQKDIGKLKENNEKLKMEMQSLKAMLAAQAKEDASNLAHTNELDAKQKEITKLEKRVAELEKQLEAEKALVEKLEADMAQQQQQMSQMVVAPPSPRGHRKGRTPSMSSPPRAETYTEVPEGMPNLQVPNLPSNYVSPEIVAKHKHNLRRLEDELSAERKHRREADAEIIKLRAQINGVELKDTEVDALLAQKLETAPAPAPRRYVDYDFALSWLVSVVASVLHWRLFVITVSRIIE